MRSFTFFGEVRKYRKRANGFSRPPTGLCAVERRVRRLSMTSSLTVANRLSRGRVKRRNYPGRVGAKLIAGNEAFRSADNWRPRAGEDTETQSCLLAVPGEHGREARWARTLSLIRSPPSCVAKSLRRCASQRLCALELEREIELGAVSLDLSLGIQLQIQLDNFRDAKVT